jgi:hypothetical protein
MKDPPPKIETVGDVWVRHAFSRLGGEEAREDSKVIGSGYRGNRSAPWRTLAPLFGLGEHGTVNHLHNVRAVFLLHANGVGRLPI